MSTCPRCLSSNAIFIEKDKWGLWKVCIYCGWERFIINQPKNSQDKLKESEGLRKREPAYYLL